MDWLTHSSMYSGGLFCLDGMDQLLKVAVQTRTLQNVMTGILRPCVSTISVSRLLDLERAWLRVFH